jgi:hypothetical protein
MVEDKVYVIGGEMEFNIEKNRREVFSDIIRISPPSTASSN